jgi:hypothetical protein
MTRKKSEPTISQMCCRVFGGFLECSLKKQVRRGLFEPAMADRVPASDSVALLGIRLAWAWRGWAGVRVRVSCHIGKLDTADVTERGLWMCVLPAWKSKEVKRVRGAGGEEASKQAMNVRTV